MSPLQQLLFWLSTKKRVTDAVARSGLRHGFARRFVAGDTLDDAMRASAQICRAGRRVTLNHLGEDVSSPDEALRARDSYIEMLRALDRAQLDGNISIKLTQLGLTFDAGLCLSLAHEIAAAAQALSRTIEMDMEDSSCTERTLDIFTAVQNRCRNAGLAIQAYLLRSEADLQRLAPLRPKIRLVKGAYHEPPGIAFQKKREVDANYRKLLARLLLPRPQGPYFTAIATHDPALLDHARQLIRERKLMRPGDEFQYEFQMLYGIRRDLQERIFAEGHPLRIYVPFGTAWLPYFMRRMAERPANLWFVLRSLFAEGKS